MIYIQSDKEKKIAHHFDCSCAIYGAEELGLDYKFVSFEEVSSGKFDNLIKNNLFVGSVEFMKEVFSRIDINHVKLPKNSNRKSELITLGEAKKRVKSTGSIFIKPIDTKLFTGFVLDEMVYNSISNIPDNTEVLAYDVFKSKILSEYRCYVRKGEVIDIRHYSGDIFPFPNKDYLINVLEENKSNFPCCYTIDIGILESGENVVIEFNDMWAIGNYGMPNYLYLRCLRERYFEIVKNGK